MSRGHRIPAAAVEILGSVPESFHDDGCSDSPDSLFGFDFRWACRIHDWRYCTRMHDPGSMTYEAKLRADTELKEHIRESLPWRWGWVRYLYYTGVHILGGFGSWDSCDETAGELCRHQQPMPVWMET